MCNNNKQKFNKVTEKLTYVLYYLFMQHGLIYSILLNFRKPITLNNISHFLIKCCVLLYTELFMFPC